MQKDRRLLAARVAFIYCRKPTFWTSLNDLNNARWFRDRLGCEGEAQLEDGASVRGVTHGGSAAMGFNDGADETEPEAQAALRATLVPAIEPFPNSRLLGCRDAWASISHFKNGIAVANGCAQNNMAAFWGVFDGIVDQVRNRLP